MNAQVAIRKSRLRRSREQYFNFTKEMIPIHGDDGSSFLSEYRQKAWEIYENIPFPTKSEAPWQRTDLRGLDAASFRLCSSTVSKKLETVAEEFTDSIREDNIGAQVISIADGYSIEIKPELADKGVIITDFETAAKENPIFRTVHGNIVKPEDGKFSALVSTFNQFGVFVYIPKTVNVEETIHSWLLVAGMDLARLSHIIVYIDDGASLTFIHEIKSLDKSEHQALHSGIVEIHVGEGAKLRFIEFQNLNQRTYNFVHKRARVHRDGNLDWIIGAVGSRLSKIFSDIDLVGQGASGRVSGFCFIDGEQHLDYDTQQNHLAPSTTSVLSFKSALKGNSRSVWQGMIYVAPGAQKTDGFQENKNLILSENARADSIPGLEILVDDVRCTHGATVGKIDPDLIFYLRSRGIPENDAARLIVEGFFETIMERIPVYSLKKRINKIIENKMRAE